MRTTDSKAGVQEQRLARRAADSDRRHQQWARALAAQVRRVIEKHPEADPDNVRHTLIMLQKPPLERLQRSLLRGRLIANKRR
jgi:hypothetical protein